MSEGTVYLDLEDLLDIARAAVDGDVLVRDHGLLEAAAARPATTVFGSEAYPDDLTKAAALLHSLVTSHPLVGGDERLGWLATVVFLELNHHHWSRIVDDEVEVLVVAIADETLRDVDKIAEELRRLWA
ncbi:MAG: Fic family protein [Pseudonocardia sp.]|nr:Fic family protein [Pseudonocardia sp.]